MQRVYWPNCTKPQIASRAETTRPATPLAPLYYTGVQVVGLGLDENPKPITLTEAGIDENLAQRAPHIELGSVLRPGFETLGWAYSGGQL